MIEAGQEKGFDVDLLYMPVSRACNPNSRRVAEMMADDLGRIGIRTHLITVPWDQYHHKVLSGDTTMAFYCWTSDNGDPDNFLGILLACHDDVASGNNIARWCNRDYDALIAQAKLTPDQGKRAEFYRQAQVIAHDQAPWLPLAHGRVLSGARKSLRGFVLDPFGRFLFDKVDIEDGPR
jgi:dipeptide transport system substrate-binding protein